MNAQVKPIRHKDVHGTEKYYLDISPDEGKTGTIIVVGKAALENVEEVLKTNTIKTTDQKPIEDKKNNNKA